MSALHQTNLIHGFDAGRRWNNSMAAQQQIDFGPQYPTRPAFFGFIVMKLAFKMCLATEIGGDALNLLMLVAMTEDSAFYRHPAWIWNKQARDYLGVCTDTLIAIRCRLVESGWLHYRYRGKKRAPEYWVTVPEGVGDEEKNDLGERLDQYVRLRSVDGVDSSSIERRSNVDQSSTDRRLKVDPFYSGPPTNNPTTSDLQADGGGQSENWKTDGGHAAPTESEALTSTQPNATAQQLAELQTRLRGVGVDLAEKTLLTALSVGHSIGSISAIIKHAEERPGWWGGGAVRLRLTNTDLALPFDRGWAKPDAKAKAKWHDELRRKAEAAKLDALSSSSPPSEGGVGGGPSETHKTQQEWDWDALERQYGERIDAASIDELCEVQPTDFAKQALRKLARREPNFRRIECHRRDLLRAFHRKAST